MQAEAGQARNQLARLEAEAGELQNEEKQVSDEVERLERQGKELVDQIRTTHDHTTRLQQQCQRDDSDSARLKEETCEMIALLQQQKSQILENEHASQAEPLKKIADLRLLKSHLESEFERAKNMESELRTRCKQDIDTREQRINKWCTEFQAAKSQLQSQCDSISEEIKHLQQVMAEDRNRIDDRRKIASTEAKKVEHMEAQNHALRHDVRFFFKKTNLKCRQIYPKPKFASGWNSAVKQALFHASGSINVSVLISFS